jgi:hypothetical protein
MKVFFLKRFITINYLALIGVLCGGIAGWLYWYNIGCATGTCPISSHPLNSTLYGMIMGGLLFSMFKKSKK